ncbi:carboxylesterase family protein [Nocardia sp. CA2R105]|uniref:carboxylesterase family protein n=1 Tax=Nocardia coffeae TaxID=2873381 RepID=UPI001CA79F57|nr:carboxylesterase family protein [Nocardia coffeae]
MTTGAGRVRGIADADVVRFRGIPYVAPPVGDRCWRRPQQVRPWTGIRDAERSGPVCATGGAGTAQR